MSILINVSSVLTRKAGLALVSDCDKGDFIVERLQPLTVHPRAQETADKSVSEGLSLTEVEENDCNDVGDAHKVVS